MNGKGTDTFKTAIQNYLEYRAATDELFAPLFANPNKSIDKCCKYIICEVHKSGMNGFDDDEIFGMAVHYYDENEIEVGNPPQCRIISNVHTDLTSSTMEVQTFIICVSTARHSVKRPLRSKLRTLPSMKVSTLIGCKVCLRRLRDYASTSEHRADFSARYFLSVSMGRRTKKVAKKPKPNILQMYKKIRKRTCG